MNAGFICCRRCPRWMDDEVGGRRSGLLFNVVGNVLGLLVSGARWYGWPLYAMDDVLGLAGDVVQLFLAFCGRWYGQSLYALNDVLVLAGDVGWSLSAFCGVRRDFSPDILG
ncbi:uncharacterized protein LOC120351115 [Nilaparvata lugens]|uniref:uncharacterized protein LOC120351115 n=1 Tax=Nilaparvata lugens TaxID=108931 RepID=UPI00193E50B4|nr:uncharacterized protein LOC120351115 [Nilaparvata lugens]